MHEVSGWGALLRLALRSYWWTVIPAVVAWVVLPPPVSVVLVLLATAVVSTGLHEVGHVMGHRLVRGRLETFRLTFVGPLAISARPETYVEHRLVVAAGPMLPALVGVILLALGRQAGSPEAVGAGVVLLVHLLGLLPGSSDGDKVWGLAEKHSEPSEPSEPSLRSADPVAVQHDGQHGHRH